MEPLSGASIRRSVVARAGTREQNEWSCAIVVRSDYVRPATEMGCAIEFGGV